jgi:hypothetical protein
MMTAAIGAVVVTLATLGHNTVQHGFYREKAECIAESGVEKAIVEIGRNPAFTGERDVPFDIGSFSTAVRTLDDGDVEITSIGQAQRGLSVRFTQRIVARVRFESGRPRIISWTTSALPTERLAEHR